MLIVRRTLLYAGVELEPGELLDPERPEVLGGRERPIDAAALIARGDACDPTLCMELGCACPGATLRAADQAILEREAPTVATDAAAAAPTPRETPRRAGRPPKKRAAAADGPTGA